MHREALPRSHVAPRPSRPRIHPSPAFHSPSHICGRSPSRQPTTKITFFFQPIAIHGRPLPHPAPEPPRASTLRAPSIARGTPDGHARAAHCAANVRRSPTPSHARRPQCGEITSRAGFELRRRSTAGRRGHMACAPSSHTHAGWLVDLSSRALHLICWWRITIAWRAGGLARPLECRRHQRLQETSRADAPPLWGVSQGGARAYFSCDCGASGLFIFRATWSFALMRSNALPTTKIAGHHVFAAHRTNYSRDGGAWRVGRKTRPRSPALVGRALRPTKTASRW
ncbi:hypothetical protein DFH09DRAFT_1272746 [Mycena vulgaris]|nr:hypothetical protein DFH09DRAFT_1272746 [Mycena vulgaris]